MDQIFSALIEIISTKNVLYLLPLIILYVLWSWNSRNQFERIFLPRNIAIIYKLLIEIAWLVGILITIFLMNFNINNILNAKFFSWSVLALVFYVILGVFYIFYALNIKDIKRYHVVNSKITKIFLVVITIILSFLIYLYLVQVTISSIGGSLESKFKETGEVLSFLIFYNNTFIPLIILLVFAVLFYIPLRNMGETIVKEFLVSFKVKKTFKVTVVLKNGKEIREVYMNNNHPGKYLNLVNKKLSSTQHIAINKEEIEYILITDENHQNDFDIEVLKL